MVELPHALEIERTVIASVLINSKIVPVVVSRLSPESFYDLPCRQIFIAVKGLYDRRSATDMVSVYNSVKTTTNITQTFLVELTNNVVGTANIEHHCAILREEQLRRDAINICKIGYQKAFDRNTDPFSVLDSIEEGAKQAEYNALIGTQKDIVTQTNESLRYIEQAKSGLPIGISTGFWELDEVTGGHGKGELIVIAGRPGMGKSALALSSIYNAAIIDGLPVILYSFEMSAPKIILRLVSMMTGIPSYKMRSGNISMYENQAITDAITKIKESPIIIDDSPEQTISSIEHKTEIARDHKGVVAIFVDYLQLIDAGKKTNMREQEVAHISKRLKILAGNADIPVIALCQLNRDVEKGGTPKPKLSHLRESGAIENDADKVGLLYRPEYYRITEPIEFNDGRVCPTRQLTVFDLAKHRDGAVKNIPLRFIDELTKFEDWEPKNTSNPFNSPEEF